MRDPNPRGSKSALTHARVSVLLFLFTQTFGFPAVALTGENMASRRANNYDMGAHLCTVLHAKRSGLDYVCCQKDSERSALHSPLRAVFAAQSFYFSSN